MTGSQPINAPEAGESKYGWTLGKAVSVCPQHAPVQSGRISQSAGQLSEVPPAALIQPAGFIIDRVERGIGIQRAAAAILERCRLQREKYTLRIHRGEDIQAVPGDARLGYAFPGLERAAHGTVYMQICQHWLTVRSLLHDVQSKGLAGGHPCMLPRGRIDRRNHAAGSAQGAARKYRTHCWQLPSYRRHSARCRCRRIAVHRADGLIRRGCRLIV